MELFLPINFHCTVNGKELTAHIIGIVDNPVNDELLIKFSNNYQDSFYLTEDGVVAGLNENKSKIYAGAIKNDMYALNCVSVNTLVWNFRYVLQGDWTNIWILYRQRSSDQRYEVYGNGEQLFELVQKDDVWDFSNPLRVQENNIDDSLIKKIIKIIEKEVHVLQ